MKKSTDNSNNKPVKASASSMRLALENRLLFDGAALATAVEVYDDKNAGQGDHTDTTPERNQDAAPDALADFGQIAAFGFNAEAVDTQPIEPGTTLGGNDAPILWIVDPRSEESHKLLASTPPNTQLFVLDPNQNGYEQIAQLLQVRGNTQQIHLLTADLEGKPWLGSSQLNINTAAADQSTLIHWGDYLDDKTSIVFHGIQPTINTTWLDAVTALTGGEARWSAEPIDTAAANQLVFIDTSVADYKILLNGIDPDATVILIDPDQDGVEQMAQAVSQYENINAIHIISHGEAGQISLGTARLNQTSIEGIYADELAQIGQHLSNNADILIYGCNFGQGDIGLQASNTLATLTGADIADSTNDTGAAARGGDWVLERQVGIIESNAFNVSAWDGLLAPIDIGGGLLKFTTPTLLSGTALQVGAVYRYLNVATVGGIQIDAYVTVTGLTNATIVTIDDPNPNGNANYSLIKADGTTLSIPDDDLFAPQISTTAAGGHVDFTVNFKDTSGNPLTLINFYNNSIDVDAPEFVEYGGFQSYELSTAPNATQLTVAAVSGTDRLRFTGTGSYLGVTLNDVGRVQTKFDSVTSLQISMGTTNATGAGNFRQYGSIFAFDKYAASVVVTAPTVNSLTTDDTTPSISGTVGNTVLGTSEAFSVTVNGVTYSKGNGALSINGLVWTLNIPTVLNQGTYEVKALRSGTLSDQTTNELIVDTNDPPTLSATAANPTFTEGSGLGVQGVAVSLFSGASVSAVESTQLINGLTFTVSNLADGADEKINVDGTLISLTNGLSGVTTTNGMNYTVSLSGNLATVSLTKAAGVSSAVINTLVNGITYQNTNIDQPTAGNRVATLTQIKDTGGTNSGGIDTRTLAISSTIKVTPVNDAPVATITPLSYVATEQVPLALKNNGISISDVDAGTGSMTVTLSVVTGILNVTSGGSGATVTNSGTSSVTITGTIAQINALFSSDAASTVNYTANSDTPPTSTTLTLQVNDNGNTGGGVLTASDTAIINIIPVNDAPVAVNDTGSATEASGVANGTAGSSASGNVLSNDTDIDTAAGIRTVAGVRTGNTEGAGTAGTVGTALVGQYGSLTLMPTGSYTYVVNNNNATVQALNVGQTLTDSFNYTMSDGSLTDIAVLNITINGANDAPTALNILPRSSTDGATGTTSSYSIGGFFSDVDGSSLTFSASGLPLGLSINPSTGLISGTIDRNASQGGTRGVYLVSVTATDAQGATVNKTFNYTVTNPPPVAVNDTASTNEETPLTLTSATLLANDFDTAPDSDPLTIISVQSAVNGTVSIAAGVVTFTPTANYQGSASFTYTISDGNGGTSTATVNITVGSVNDAPTGANSTVTILEDTVRTVTAANFGFSDPLDTPVNSFSGILVSSLPSLAEGTYTLNGVAISAGQFISTTDINAGLLVFNPVANVNGSNLGALGFRVRDNGGTANGGVDTDPTPNILNFNITAQPDDVVVGGLNDGAVGGTDAQVKESDLLAGSNPSGTGETTSGTFTLSPSNSLVSLTLGGTSISKAQLSNSAVVPISISGTNGTLTINSFNITTGVVSYSYTLTSAANHSSGNINDNFVIGTTDVDGDTAANAGTLAINILDDIPTAANDIENTINTSGNPSSIGYGNVFTGSSTGVGGIDPNAQDGVSDTLGADTRSNPVTGLVAGTGVVTSGVGIGGAGIAGSFGTLVMNANGSYRYTPNFANPAVSGLLAPSTLTDTFTYQITDNDGDSTTATITITILPGPSIAGLGDGTVDNTDGSVLESDLATGTNPSGNGEILNGNFQIFTGLQTVATADALVIGGTTINKAQLENSATTNISIAGTSFGTLRITNYNSTTGVVSYGYTLSGAQNHGTPQESLTVTLKDDLGNTTTGNLSIAIIDDTPVATADTASINENNTSIASNAFNNDKIGADGASTAPAGPVTGLVVGTGLVTSGTGVGSPVAGLNGYGSLTIASNGSYTYTLNTTNSVVNGLQVGEQLTDVFTYQITDGDGDVQTTTITITINGQNDPPVAFDDTISIPEDSTNVPLNLVANDGPDPDGDTLQVTSINGVSINGSLQNIAVPNGTVTVTAGGAITFTPNPNYTGPITFPYIISDGHGGTSQTNVNLTITNINDPPVANPDTATTPINTPVNNINLKGNDTDIDNTNAQLTVSAPVLANPALGTVTLNTDGTLNFAPAHNVTGPVVINYTLTDPGGATSTGTLTVTVGPNSLPDSLDVTRTTLEDTPRTFVQTDFALVDPDAGLQTLAAVRIDTLPTNGTLTLNGSPVTTGTVLSIADITAGNFEFVPDANENGINYASFKFSVQDDAGSFDTVPNNFTINVTPVNDAPVITGDLAAPINEGGTYLLTPADLGFSDVDDLSNGVVFTTNNPINGVVLVNGVATTSFTPAQLAAGQVSFLHDGSETTVASFDVNIEDGNEDRSVPISHTFSFNVTPINDPPVLTGDRTASVDEGGEYTITPTDLGFTDPDDVTTDVTFSISNPVNGAILVNGVPATSFSGDQLAAGLVSFLHDGSETTSASFQVSVEDGNEDNSTPINLPFNLTINPVNDAPVANDDGPFETFANTQTSGNVVTGTGGGTADTDAENNTLTVTQFAVDIDNDGIQEIFAAGTTATMSGIGTLIINPDGSFIFTPVNGYNDFVPSALYTISDGNRGTDTANLSFTNLSNTPPPPPDVRPDTNIIDEDNIASGNVLSNDTTINNIQLSVTSFTVNGVTVTANSQLNIPNVGILAINQDGSYLFTPARDFSGSVPDVTYNATDGFGNDVPGTLNLTVNPVVDTVTDVVSTPEDKPVRFNPLANDNFGPDARLTGVTQPAHGGLILNSDGTITYTPDRDFNGKDSFTYTVTTPDGKTETSTVELTITPAPDPRPRPLTENIGALIMLSNPAPPLFPNATGSAYSLPQFRELDPIWSSDKPYNPSRLSLSRDWEQCDLYLKGSLRNRTVTAQMHYNFSVPREAFCHCNINEELEFTATQVDGTSLPHWLHFDPKTLKFTGIPPKDAKTTDVTVTAKDQYGNTAHATFRVNVNKDNIGIGKMDKEAAIKVSRDIRSMDSNVAMLTVNGKAGFNEQLGKTGKLTRLMESRALLDSLGKL